MNQDQKLTLARQVMQISGVFSLVVAALLVINFLQLRKYETLESDTMTLLIEQLKDDPRNDDLREEIREFDLMVRKAYFTSSWQVNTGAVLLLIGGILFAVSLKVYTDILRKIEEPSSAQEAFLQSRKMAWRWLVVTGMVLFGLAFLATFSTTSYLDNYMPEAEVADGSSETDPDIEVIAIGGAEDSEGSERESTAAAGQTEADESSTEGGEASAGGQASVSADAGTAGGQATQTASAASEEVYGFEEFKKHHNTFRGPMGLGISYHKNIPVQWDGAQGQNVIWKVAISKPGYNSPVIWGDKLFLAGGDDAARVVTCYDRNTGQVLWEKAADNIQGSPAEMPDVTEDTGLSAPTMAVDGYRVYAIFASGDVIAFDLDGNRVWARNLGVPVNHYGHSSSLMVWNQKLIIQYDTGSSGRMLALNTSTGETVWDVDRDNNISWASPILIDYDGKVQVVTNTDPNVAGHDVETGEEIWKVPAMMGEVGPSCAYEDGLVFANNEYASMVAINPEPGASVQWESYDYLSEAASPVAQNGLLYLATSYGVFVCYDAKTGEQVWE
ncbi:MAG TPA: PQQ-binding-like beta-propeller repeat protein, partial [Bacteroidales bacterium]|nr:PQQ-binding-like beta-propeller repeat protein [Bacteroidales bacterium]